MTEKLRHLLWSTSEECMIRSAPRHFLPGTDCNSRNSNGLLALKRTKVVIFAWKSPFGYESGLRATAAQPHSDLQEFVRLAATPAVGNAPETLQGRPGNGRGRVTTIKGKGRRMFSPKLKSRWAN
jgi:hypothetical protein